MKTYEWYIYLSILIAYSINIGKSSPLQQPAGSKGDLGGSKNKTNEKYLLYNSNNFYKI